jgi:hypothetical protein
MRITTLLSAAAIAALTTINPVLAYGPSAEGPSFSHVSGMPQKAMSAPERGETKVAFAVVKEMDGGAGYVLIRNDGGATTFRNCDASDKCTTDTIDVHTSGSVQSATIKIDCQQVGGCLIVGKR